MPALVGVATFVSAGPIASLRRDGVSLPLLALFSSPGFDAERANSFVVAAPRALVAPDFPGVRTALVVANRLDDVGLAGLASLP